MHEDISNRDLADALNARDSDPNWDPWSDGYVEVKGRQLAIDPGASDALAARRGHPGRNQQESRWMVADGLEVEYTDGIGWMPVGPGLEWAKTILGSE